MKQRNIWMLLFLTGILSSFFSCKEGEVDHVSIRDYYLINNSDCNLSIDVYNKLWGGSAYYWHTTSHSILQGDTLMQSHDFMSGSITGIISLADSVEIAFADTKKVSFGKESESSFNLIQAKYDNYKREDVGERHVKFIYTFTQEDYNNATPLETNQ